MARAPQPVSPLDHLYQVPLGEFVAARNALAKTSGAEGAAIRALQKPSLPAWAVNQLYWRRRDVHEALIERAQDLRATHDATLKGTRADLRGASRAHEEAVEAALKATLAILAEDGQPATEATRQAIATTLRGLPADEQPGRLTRQIQPRGFDMLAAALPGGKVRPAAPPSNPGGGLVRRSPGEGGSLAAAREALTSATRDARLAEQAARREEFESARAAREADKATQRLEAAKEAVRDAQAALKEATREAEVAEKASAEARKRAEKATADMEEMREREKKARAAVEKAAR